MKRVLILALLALAAAILMTLHGCAIAPHHPRVTPIDYENPPAPDFPKLRVDPVRVPQSEIDRRCPGTMAGYRQRACALLYFTAGVCRILLADDAPDALREHEEKHCQGYDHPGESGIHDAWQNFKRRAI